MKPNKKQQSLTGRGSCKNRGDRAQEAIEQTPRGEGSDGGPLAREDQGQRHQRSWNRSEESPMWALERKDLPAIFLLVLSREWMGMGEWDCH